MKIIIFGGHGFVGKNLSSYLQKKKIFVKSYGNAEYEIQKKNLIKYDKKNFKKILLKYKPDGIFFLSGNSYPLNSLNEKHDFNSSNLKLQNLLQVLVEVKYKNLFFFLSSTSIFGSSYKKKVNEEFKKKPESFYSLSKVVAENQIKFFSDNFDIKSVVLRASSLYGEELKRQIIYKIVESIKLKKRINLLGFPSDARQFLYVGDLISIIYKILRKKNIKGFNLFNVAFGDNVKITQIIKILEKITNKKIKFKFYKKTKQPLIPCVSNLKIKKFIKFNKFTNFYTGLKNTYEWVIKS